MPCLRVGMPDRRAARRSGAADACASPKTPACNADCARRPVRRRSSRCSRSSISAPPPRTARVLKEEEPFGCIRCGKPFGVKSTIERVSAKLESKHWMFKGSARAARHHQDVRGLPRRDGDRAGFRSLRRAGAAQSAHDRGLSARARHQADLEAAQDERRYFFAAARARNSTSALRSSAEPMVCSGILVPGV